MSREVPPHPDQLSIKELFGNALEACEQGGRRQAERVLSGAPETIREAVRDLLESHRRATGALLDDAGGPRGSQPADTPPVDSETPNVAGYRIERELGRGGFGVVYQAWQRSPIERRVALKVLRSDLTSEETIRRFRAESTVLARMSHESIAGVFDAGLTEQGQPFVAMEFIDGLPLLKSCDELDLSADQRVELMARVCDAVQHAHQRAVIHRDLKPDNVLVERTAGGFRPRVIDFGIAKLLDPDPDNEHTRAQVLLGTPRYMSPEQRAGGNAIDVRVDIYALGAILCEVLAGDIPGVPGERAGTSSPDVAQSAPVTRPSKIATRSASRYRTSSKTLRGDLDRIILKACAEDPDLRYPSAQAMGDDLRRYLAGLPVSATRPGMPYLVRKFCKRHRATVAIAATLCVALVVTLGVAIQKWGEASRQRDQARSTSERVAFIGEFLLEMLLLTSDHNARGAPPAIADGTMQKIADRATDGLREDPEHMLAMLAGIGRFQAHAGQAEAGAATIRTALEFAIGHYGLPSPEVVQLRIALHDILWGHGLDGWKPQIELADAESEQLFASDDPRRLRVVQRARGSAENLQRIVDRYESLGSIDPGDHYHALFSLTMVHRFGPTPERQLETSKRLYEIAIGNYPPSHTHVIDAMAIYGDSLIAYDPGPLAEEILLEGYAQSKRVLGPDHFTTESIRRGLARLYGALGEPERGIQYALEDLDSVARGRGTESIQYANALFELGRLRLYAEEYEQARSVMERSLALREQQWSVGHPQIVTAQAYLARIYVELGEHDLAQAVANAALQYLTDPRDARTIAYVSRVLIVVHEQLGNRDRADTIRAETRARLALLGLDDESIESLLLSW